MKGPDMIACFACSNCHAFIDGAQRWEVSAYDYLRAIAETQMAWIEDGLMVLK
jgi:hypothetical protein